MRNHIIFCSLLILTACVQPDFVEAESDNFGLYGVVSTKTLNSVTGHHNPYTLKNMQAASDSLNASLNLPLQQLEPTDLYLCFMPEDTLEVKSLEDQGYELFAYPLDDNYEPDYLPSDTLSPLYCVVPFDEVLPAVEHCVIDTCYIPTVEGPELIGRLSDEACSYAVQLERLAYKLSGNEIDSQNEHQGRSLFHRYGPSGIMSLDWLPDSSETNVPLKRIKVVANSFVRVRTQYTDESGAFDFPDVFINPPKIRIKSVSSENCKVYDTNHYTGVSPTEYILPGTYETDASSSFDTTSFYNSALVFKYYNDYIDICERESIPLPPSDLNISIVRSRDFNGGAPMLKHLTPSDAPCVFDDYLDMLVDHTLSIISHTITFTLLKGICPDVIINCDDPLKTRLYVFHELTHASHFANGCSRYWEYYITKIVSSWLSSSGHDVYGNGYDNDLGQHVLELSESLAYCVSHLRTSSTETVPWFVDSYNTIMGLITTCGVSVSDLFGVLNSSVTSMDDLCCALCLAFPRRERYIAKLFHDYSSLIHESIWMIHNNTGGDLDIRMVWDDTGLSAVIHQGEEACLVYSPFDVPINTIRNEHPNLYPYTIEIKKGGNLIFAQNNRGLPSITFSRPFLMQTEWESSITRENFRGREITTYRFNVN